MKLAVTSRVFSRIWLCLIFLTTAAQARHALLTSFTAEVCPNGEFARRTRLTIYYTPVLSDLNCKDGQLGVLNSTAGAGKNCRQKTIDGIVDKMEGAGAILGRFGEHWGVLVNPKGPIREILDSGLKFSKTLPKGTPRDMFYVTEPRCPLGYGSKIDGKPVCLDPFRTVACAPKHAVGQVLFLPAAVGIKYPRFPGEPRSEYELKEGHDGYFVCGDIGDAIQGEHVDLFTAFVNPSDRDNPFSRFGSTIEHGVCWISNDSSKDPGHHYRYHSATDVTPRFPALDDATIVNYTDEFRLSNAFRLGSLIGAF